MPTKAQPTVYVGGDDPAVVEKRRAYEEALDRLNRSLDARQQRFFDPAMLAAAQELLSPGKTGSFFEAAGRAAGAYGRGQEALIKEEQDIARAQMEMAQMGLEGERQRQQDIRLRGFLSGAGESATPATPGGGALGAPQQMPTQTGLGAPSGVIAGPAAIGAGPLSRPPSGIQIAPEDPYRMTGRKFIELNKGSMPMQDLLKEAARIDAENTKITEAGRYDVAGGKYFPALTGKPVDKRIFPPGGKPETVSMTDFQAYALDQAAANNDPKAYQQILDQVRFGPFAGQAQPAQARLPAGAPEAAASTGMGALATTEPVKSVAETAAETKAQETLAVERTKSAAKAEEDLRAKNEAAQRALFAAADTERLVKKNPTAFGRLSQPGVMTGILNLVSQGLQTPSGSISIPQLDTFIVQTTGKEGDLIDRQLAARNMAELELAFRRQYFAGYGGGSISNMEQSVVNQLAASPVEDPRTIQSKMKLIKMRAQYDVDEYRNWLQYKRQNKGKTYDDFTSSDEYLNRQDEYSSKLGKAFGVEPAVPSEKKAAPSWKFTPEQVNAASQRLKSIFGQGAK